MSKKMLSEKEIRRNQQRLNCKTSAFRKKFLKLMVESGSLEVRKHYVRVNGYTVFVGKGEHRKVVQGYAMANGYPSVNLTNTVETIYLSDKTRCYKYSDWQDWEKQVLVGEQWVSWRDYKWRALKGNTNPMTFIEGGDGYKRVCREL